MKLKFNSRFDDRHPKGKEVEVDSIRHDSTYVGGFKVRVIGEWKRPRWISIAWFIGIPDSVRIMYGLQVIKDKE